MKNKLYLLIILAFAHSFSQNMQNILQNIFTLNQLMGMSVYTYTDNNDEIYNFGYKNFNQNLLIDNNTKFRIASISKSFTALGLMKLYDQNLFQLDDPISNYLGYSVINPNFPNIPITFRMLLSHTSSLQDGTGYSNFLNATYSQTPIVNISSVLVPTGSYFTANMWRTESPGTYFNYSNINYGLIGTLIEKISNQRFDIFMKNEILLPLQISGSFNIQDISNHSDVATLYRKPNNQWLAQADFYPQGMPAPPNLGNYINGTNGAYFSPQGGLRISTTEAAKFLKFLKSNGQTAPNLISAAAIQTMKSVQWLDNGTNGNDYYGLFNKWALGLQYANTNTDDFVCNSNFFGNFIGHNGEAYGLISDAFFSETLNKGFVFITNGSTNGYQTGPNSFYTIENQVFDAICTLFNQSLKTENFNITTAISPNPADSHLEINASNLDVNYYEIIDLLGKIVIPQTKLATSSETISTMNLNAGVYFMKLINDKNIQTYKLIINH